jgi:hypothetical protein
MLAKNANFSEIMHSISMEFSMEFPDPLRSSSEASRQQPTMQ